MAVSLKNMNTTHWSLLLLVVFSLASCSKKENREKTQGSARAEIFASSQDAEEALVQAAKSDNRDALLTIFGPGSRELIYSGDPEQDKASLAGLVADYEVMHRWRKLGDGSQLLLLGADNKAFPVPLRKDAAGRWSFDTEAGKREILARRIGRDELAAMDVCAVIAEAQMEYYAQRHEFATRFISSDGKQNGLYWQSADGQPKSLLGPLLAFATAEGYTVKPDAHQPFHGYFFRMLDTQGAAAKGGAKEYIKDGNMTGGFGVVAYPAQYRVSGIMTFIINQDGVVYEKDLGKTTGQRAAEMTTFNPDSTWNPVGL